MIKSNPINTLLGDLKKKLVTTFSPAKVQKPEDSSSYSSSSSVMSEIKEEAKEAGGDSPEQINSLQIRLPLNPMAFEDNSMDEELEIQEPYEIQKGVPSLIFKEEVISPKEQLIQKEVISPKKKSDVNTPQNKEISPKKVIPRKVSIKKEV